MMIHASKEVWDKPQIPPLEPPLVLFLLIGNVYCVLSTKSESLQYTREMGKSIFVSRLLCIFMSNL